jgi:hypothetical protein
VEEATAAPVLEKIDDSACDELGWAPTMAGGDEVYALREGGRVVGVVALELRAVESAEFGRCATVKRAIAAPNADVGCQTRLLGGAAAAAHEAGLSGVIVYVDSDNGDLVNASRLAGFQHDRTDVRYQLGDRR